ncbi:MAG TPA: hypothetical protein VHF89_02285 [Solirubrobacteraceae bacterium]|nr:hypothetical protein [Solirubrobacteraceae bacterium]
MTALLVDVFADLEARPPGRALALVVPPVGFGAGAAAGGRALPRP